VENLNYDILREFLQALGHKLRGPLGTISNLVSMEMPLDNDDIKAIRISIDHMIESLKVTKLPDYNNCSQENDIGALFGLSSQIKLGSQVEHYFFSLIAKELLSKNLKTTDLKLETDKLTLLFTSNSSNTLTIRYGSFRDYFKNCSTSPSSSLIEIFSSLLGVKVEIIESDNQTEIEILFL